LATASRVGKAPECAEPGVRLDLSYEEAVVLMCTVANVAGDRYVPPVAHNNTVYEALRGAGVDYYYLPIRHLRKGELRYEKGDVL